MDKLASLVEVMNFFGAKPAQFRAEWTALTDADKNALRAGIGDGSLTY